MKALTVVPGDPISAELSDVAEPSPSEGAVLVGTVAVGICGTDKDIVENGLRPATARGAAPHHRSRERGPRPRGAVRERVRRRRSRRGYRPGPRSGSVNAAYRHYEQGAAALTAADPTWLHRLLTRRVEPAEWPTALSKKPDDIKVVVGWE